MILLKYSGLGYMFSCDIPSPEYATQIIDIANKHHLIILRSYYGKSCTLKVRPPLICTHQHIDEIINKLDITFNEMNQLKTNKPEVMIP